MLNKKCDKCKKEVKALYWSKIKRNWECEKCTNYFKEKEKKVI